METDTKKSSSPHILVVEDDDSLALLLGYNLESEGYRVSRVDRGDEADTLLQEMVPDLVILDWMLPGVSGFELCRRLRGRDGGSELPIILLTARGEETDRIRGLSIGADDYVVKPFSVPELSVCKSVISHSTNRQSVCCAVSARFILDLQNFAYLSI